MAAAGLRLAPQAVVETLRRLEERILARFPGASLAQVAAEVRVLTEEAARTADMLARPAWGLRLLVAVALAAGIGLLGWLLASLEFRPDSNNLFGLIQSIDALVNVVIIVGAAILSLLTIEGRLRRARGLRALQPFRAVVHVIDMHQLTKDPVMVSGATTTSVSPKRDMTPFELQRYLDYCSELLSLTAKAAALHALATGDPAIVTAVNEIEQLTANLSQKIWQKIMIVQAIDAQAGARED